MKKIRILAVCPYPGMNEIFTEIASERDDLEITSFVGDLDKGLETARQEMMSRDYDFIVSRGGTAELIAPDSTVPLLEIPISTGDLLHAIKAAESCWDRCAIVGFAAVIENARIVCELLNYDIEMRTIHSADEALLVIKELAGKGRAMFIGDNVTSYVASELGLGSILITSSPEMINNVVNQALKLYPSISKMRMTGTVLEQVLAESDGYACALDGQGRQIYSTFPERREYGRLIAYVTRRLPDILAAGEKRYYRKTDEMLYSVEARMSTVMGATAVIVSASPVLFAGIHEDQAVKFVDASTPEEDGLNFYFYKGGKFTASVREETAIAAADMGPVMMIGETGTEKKLVTDYIYRNGPYKSNPCCIVDFSKMSERTWKKLTESTASPMHGKSITLCFKNVDRITQRQADDMVAFIKHSNLCRRCKLILSITAKNGVYRENEMCDFLLNKQDCHTLYIPTLREKREDIPEITTTLINHYNLKHGTQLVGFNAEAMELLQDYEWPGNINQLKRVVRDLLDKTEGPYIDTERVEENLDKEKSIYCCRKTDYSAGGMPERISLNKPLNGIIFDVVDQILQEEGMNKKRTATRLGISRTTLWRITKSSEVSGGVPE